MLVKKMGNFKKRAVFFTQVSNQVLNDERLSFKAKGLYAYLFSKPDGWDFNGDRMAKQSSDGRKAVYAGLKELEASGYLKRTKKNDGKVDYFLEVPELEPVDQKGKQDIRQTAEMGSISNKELLVIKTNSNIDNNIAEPSSAVSVEPDTNKQIAEIIDLFKKSLNPTINFGHKTHRRSAEEVIKQFGFEKAKQITEFAIKVQGQRFAPTITTPTELKNNIGKLQVFAKREMSPQKAGIQSL